MTGFGSSERQINGKTIIIEVKSLNSKGFDLNLKLPQQYSELEQQIRSKVAGTISRGKVNLTINLEITGTQDLPHINGDAVINYVAQIEEVSRKIGIEQPDRNMFLRTALTLPESLKTGKRGIDEKEYEAFMECLQEAIDETDKFRTQEGKAMESDLEKRIESILGYLGEVPQHEKTRTETIRNRIQQSLQETLQEGDIDRNRFHQEIIYYLEKIDITEEKVRIENHCEYFREVIKKGEAPGRIMNFILQEMLREINTLGSKSNDFQIQKLVVQMKDELEKIREQAMNIE